MHSDRAGLLSLVGSIVGKPVTIGQVSLGRVSCEIVLREQCAGQIRKTARALGGWRRCEDSRGRLMLGKLTFINLAYNRGILALWIV